MTSRGSFLPALLVGLAMILCLALPATPQPKSPTSLLSLGPLPLPPEGAESSVLDPEVDRIDEWDVSGPWPREGRRVPLVPGRPMEWKLLDVEDPGSAEAALEEIGVYWFATAMDLSRYAELEFIVHGTGTIALYLDGTLIDEVDAIPEAPFTTTTNVHRGGHRLYVRLELRDPDSLPITTHLEVSASPEAKISFSPRASRTLANLAHSRLLPNLGSLVLSPDGHRLARQLTLAESIGSGSQTETALFEKGSDKPRHGIGPSGTRPLRFGPNGRFLLLRRSGDEGTDLLLFDLETNKTTPVVLGEEGFLEASFSPDGKLLLVRSDRGAHRITPDSKAPARRLHLRESVPDYAVEGHLHLIDVGTGARRRLTPPQDAVLDDAIFTPDGRGILYGLTRPRDERPYFDTEILHLDLTTGKERSLAKFVMGWEVRPQQFAISFDGAWLAFLGPAEEIGEDRPEHNVYHRHLYRLDLASGSWQNLTRNLGPSFGAGGGQTFGWSGTTLIACVQDGARVRVARLEEKADAWVLEKFPQSQEVIRNLTVSADGSTAAYIASGRTETDTLVRLDLATGEPSVLERPFSPAWELSYPIDEPFVGPGGETVERWWYPPVLRVDDGKTPLIVYYYGGASPTSKSLNSLHQMFAAHGYAVLVVNPRGAAGRGQEFADHHVADWGPKAAADILRAVETFLEAHPEIDAKKIGIYGGSYGGFMTQYLVSISDRFSAAISLYGISDLTSYWGQGAWGWTYGDMSVGGALPWKDPDFFVRHSPLFRADRIKTPLLLLHGTADSNVTPGESIQLFTALKMQNRPVELVLFPGEDHGLSSSFGKRVEHRTMMLEWFDKILRGQEEAWQDRFE